VGFRRTLVIGTLTIAVGLVVLASMADIDGGFASVLPATLILGAGIGLTMSPSTAAITSALPDEKQGVAASLNDTVRELGAAVGIALLGSVLNASYRTNVAAAAAGLPGEAAEAVEEGIGGALVVAGQLGPDGVALVDAARGAFVDGMTPALLLGAGACVLAAAFTAIRGPKTAAEAEPRLHPDLDAQPDAA
jgi:fucose permease